MNESCEIVEDYTATTQTWDLSENLHDRIFGPKILHTKSATIFTKKETV